MVELKGFKVNKIELENRVKPGTQLKLQNQLNYNMNYLNDNKTCVGILNFRLTDESANPFECKVEMVAEFNYTPDEERTDIHVTSFDQLFPFLRQLIHTVTSVSGMQGLMIPILHLNRNTVRVNENVPEGSDNSPLN